MLGVESTDRPLPHGPYWFPHLLPLGGGLLVAVSRRLDSLCLLRLLQNLQRPTTGRLRMFTAGDPPTVAKRQHASGATHWPTEFQTTLVVILVANSSIKFCSA
ncbi:MAG: hypothetical protein F4Z75_10130 [Synechococcus sp. SB0668_bin_15]|nr:hypothetical protein [Synechococcus sp. SB0668_bin_15]MXZ82981.1 hypothetical protein [Synechococcus sp. SB0666_bin_14]MYC49944.1 hypothetical protein [Synechococcus sp. SB0662_bin_14]MYJ60597.1 hypothetical protein [Synechococcus sp. SB0672_bin_6]MYK92059.1 hypothetical protein [Synechococcus sp. SB0669_bin_8]